MVKAKRRRIKAGRLMNEDISDIIILNESNSSEHIIDSISQQLNNCKSRIESSVEEQRRSREVIEDLQSKINSYRRKNAAAQQNLGSTSSLFFDTSFNITIPFTSTNTLYDNIGMSLLTQEESDKKNVIEKSNDNEHLTSVITTNFNDLQNNVTLQTTTSCHDLVEPLTSVYQHHHYSSDNINRNIYNESRSEIRKDKGCCDSNISLSYINTLDHITHLLEEEQKKNAYLENIIEMSKMHTETVLIANQGFVNDVNRLQHCLMICETEKRDDEEYFKVLNKNHRSLVTTVYIEAHKLWHLYTDLKNEFTYLQQQSKIFKESQKQISLEISQKMEQKLTDSIMSILRRKKDEIADNEGIIEMLTKKYEEISLDNVKKEQEVYEASNKVRSLENFIRKLKDDRNKAFDTLIRISRIPEFDLEKKGIYFQKKKNIFEDKTDDDSFDIDNDNINLNFNEFASIVRSSFKNLKNDFDKLKIENSSLKGKLNTITNELQAIQSTSLNYEKQIAQQLTSNTEITQIKAEKDRMIRRLEERISKLEFEKEEKQEQINSYIEELAEIKTKHQNNINELVERQKTHIKDLVKQYEDENEDKNTKADNIIKKVEKDNDNLRKELESVRNELRQEVVDKNSMTRKLQQLENIIVDKDKQIKTIQNEFEEQRVLYYEDKMRILELETENEHMNSEADEVKELKRDMEHKNNLLMNDIKMFKSQLNELKNKILDMNELNEKLKNSTEEYQDTINDLNRELIEANEEIVILKTENASISSNYEMYQGKEKIWDSEKKSLKEEIDHNLGIISNMNNEKGELLKEIEKLHATLQECEEKMSEDDRLIEELTQKLESEEEFVQKSSIKNTEYDATLNDMKEKIALLENTIANKQREIDELNKYQLEHKKTIESNYNESKIRYEYDIQKFKQEADNNINELKREISRLDNLLTETEDKLNDKVSKNEKLEKEINIIKNHYDKTVSDYEIRLKEKSDEIEYLIDKKENEAMKLEEENNNFKKKVNFEISRLSDELQIAEERLKKEIDMYEELKINYEKEKKESIESRNLIDELSFKLDETTEQLDRLNNVALQKSDLDKVTEKLKKEKQSLMEEVLFEKDNNYQLLSSLTVAEKKLAKNNALIADMEGRIEELEKSYHEKVHEEDRLKLTINDLQRQLVEESKKSNDLFSEKEYLNAECEKYKKSLVQAENEIGILDAKLVEKKERYEYKKEELHVANKKINSIEEELSQSIKQIEHWERLFQEREKEYEKKLSQTSEDKEKIQYMEESIEELDKRNSNLLKEIASLKNSLEEEKKNKNKIVEELTIRSTELEREKYEVIRFCDEKVVDIEILKNKINMLTEKLSSSDNRNKQLETECFNYLEKLRNYELSLENASMYIFENEKNSKEEVFECPAGYSNCRLPRLLGKDKDSEIKKTRFSSAERINERRSNYDNLTGSMHNIDQSEFVDKVFEMYKKRIHDLEQERVNYRLQLQNLQTELNILSNNFKGAEDKIEESEKNINKLKKERLDLENNLKNTRQLYLAQEENTRAKDIEKKNLKAKILSVDLHSRDKEARLQLLNNTVIQLQEENQILKKELEQFEDRERRLLLEKDSLENKLCNIKTEMEITRHELNTVDKEKQTIMTTFHNVYRKSSKTVESSDNYGSLILHWKELEKLISNKKELLQRLENEEAKRVGRGDLKNAHFEIMQLEGRLETFKVEFATLVEKFKNCESEKDYLRKELLECKHQLSTAKIKINDLQITINTLSAQKKKAEEMLSYVEKNEKNILQMKTELHNDVSHMKTDRLKLIGEIEDLKRRLLRCEVEKRELEAQRGRLDREKLSLIRTVETLEADKNKLDGLLKKCSSEKVTLDKTLTTIEKENSELYKNVSMLRSQIGQMEKERLTKQSENAQKRKTQAEMEINRLTDEKRQLEKLYNQRDHNYSKKITALEQEISSLKITLEVERKRRLEQLKIGNANKGTSTSITKYESIAYKK
uniref:RING-type domain-containing protein n=1 Tax=Parastrongyloides trichosuri TaxID=131310 RepID=A0A0N5A3E6_PARTI